MLFFSIVKEQVQSCFRVVVSELISELWFSELENPFFGGQLFNSEKKSCLTKEKVLSTLLLAHPTRYGCFALVQIIMILSFY